MKLLTKFLDGEGEMVVLWERLRQARNKANMSVQEAWQTICNMKTGSVSKKRRKSSKSAAAPVISPRSTRH